MSKSYRPRGFRKNTKKENTIYHGEVIEVEGIGEITLQLDNEAISDGLQAYKEVLISDRNLRDFEPNVNYSSVATDPVVSFYYTQGKEVLRLQEQEILIDRDELLAELKADVKEGLITKDQLEEELGEFEEKIRRHKKTTIDVEKEAVAKASSYYKSQIAGCQVQGLMVALFDNNFRIVKENNLSKVALKETLNHFRLSGEHFEDEELNKGRMELNQYPTPDRNRFSVVEQKLAYINVFTQINPELNKRIVNVLQNIESYIRQGGHSSLETDEKGFHPSTVENDLDQESNTDN